MRLRHLTLAALLCTAIGCTVQVEGKAPSKSTDNASPLQKAVAEEIRIPVEAQFPSRKSINLYQKASFRIQAERHVDFVSKGTGQCIKVIVDEGDTIKKGDILAELDREELQAQIRQSQVNVDQTKYQMGSAQDQNESGIGKRVDSENAKFTYQQALASLDLLNVQLSHQTIRAPINGIITRRDIQEGKLITSGAPVFSITDPDSLYLPIYISDKELPRLAVGQKAFVTIDALGGETFDATVRRINPSVDATLLKSKVILDFTHETRKRLVEGAFATVLLVMETHENALVVPKDAVREEYTRTFLMVVQDAPDLIAAEEATATDNNAVPEATTKIAAIVEVQTGLEDSEHIEILSGIDDQTLVITLGQNTLDDGTAVKITNAYDEVQLNADLSAEEALAKEKAKNAFPKADKREYNK